MGRAPTRSRARARAGPRPGATRAPPARAVSGAARRATLREGRSNGQGLGRLPACSPSAQHRDEAMQRLCRGFLVLHHGDANVAEARIGAIGLVPRQIAAGSDAQPRLAPQPERGRLVATLRRHIEPQEKTAGWSPIAVTVADDLVGKIEFLRV